MIYEVRVRVTETHDLAIIASSPDEALKKAWELNASDVRASLHIRDAKLATQIRYSKPAARNFKVLED